MSSCKTVHRAKWVFSVSTPPVANGAVVVQDGGIVEVGGYRYITRGRGDKVIDHGEVAIIPGLINAHTHLELSAFDELGKKPHAGGFVSWVKSLLRAKSKIGANMIEEAMYRAARSLWNTGTVLCADIGNDMGNCVKKIGTDRKSVPIILSFLEVLGFSAERIEEILPSFLIRGEKKSKEAISVSESEKQSMRYFSLAAHAVYSTSPELIRQVKKWNSDRGKLMSIHVAEHEEELRFMQSGNGPCKELLKERGQWSSGWKTPGCSSVAYLERLGVLDSSTVSVHLVFVSEADIEILRGKAVPVVVCPRSNWYLTGNIPPVGKFVERGLVCGVGSDSLASVPDLNIFSEMQFLVDKMKIPPTTALQMATINGARVLRFDHELGSLDPGKKAFFMKVPVSSNSREICEEIIERGSRGDLSWVM